MQANDKIDKSDLNNILSKLNSLEERIKEIEKKVGIESIETNETTSISEAQTAEIEPQKEKASIESRVGGYGLALLGNIVLLFGIIFISQYIQVSGYPLYSAIFGFVSVAGIFLLSNYLKKTITYMSSMFNIFGNLLLYFVVLRLHFYVDKPLITNYIIGIILILAVIGYLVFYAFRKKSELYAGIAIGLSVATAVISNTTHLMLSLLILVSAGSVYLLYKFEWKKLTVISIILVYFSFLYWLLNYISLVKHANVAVAHNYSHYYLLVCAGIFSMLNLIPPKDKINKNYIFTSVLINGIAFTMVLIEYVFTFFKDNYTGLFIIISIYCIVFSIILHSYSKWKFSPAMYSLFGFSAISVFIYGFFGLPLSYFYLSIESLLVVSMALWFRSKTIVSMNTGLFLMFLMSYLFTSEYDTTINYSFALAALITARVINWKKERLEIQTEILRNLYLIVAFFMIPFALHESVPDKYVTLSWTIAAIAYFLLSIILKNVKYRLMAIFTMIAAAAYLFLVDLSKISIIYKIIAFLFLAVISISISIYYSRQRKKPVKEDDSPYQQDIDK